MEQEKQSFTEKAVNKIRQSPTIKLFIIGILILVLLIPSGMIEGLIREREENHNSAINEISDKWGKAQVITGPVIAVPYTETIKNESGQFVAVQRYSYYLPDDLSITGDVQSQKRHRGIYEAVLYAGKLHFEGNFDSACLNTLPALPATARLNEAKILLGISDVRGIRNKVALNWNNTNINAQPAADEELFPSAISFPLTGIDLQNGGNFGFDLDFAGSQSLYFTPVGKNNKIKLTSNWGGPSFDGAFLPTSHTENVNGFTAEWSVLELNRSFVQHWLGQNSNLHNSDFGVRMWMSADEYQKSHRSVHYCVLFISLTFIFFFIIELRSKISVHPVQYLLIGLAISIFYLLLLSLSEWTGFNPAYFISAAAVTTLISLFSISVLESKFYSLITAIIQVLLYAFLFTTLQLEDLSLLIGSIGLFLTLAIFMYFSRRLNKQE
ncbi:MAG TPA: cell envelope integrity protein CreD [Chitinophagales bacterium]|nr:cell envelope integrity protein CreD [Chitinophagales bacterium]